jgi:hypothetical protein
MDRLFFVWPTGCSRPCQAAVIFLGRWCVGIAAAFGADGFCRPSALPQLSHAAHYFDAGQKPFRPLTGHLEVAVYFDAGTSRASAIFRSSVMRLTAVASLWSRSRSSRS